MSAKSPPPNPLASAPPEDRAELLRRLDQLEAQRDEALRQALLAEQQRDLARELALRFEREAQQARESLASDLGQSLAGHAAALRSLAATFQRRLAGREPSLGQLAALMIGATDAMLGAVGDSLNRIRPEPLSAGGLPAALTALLEDWRLRVPSMRFELLLHPADPQDFGLGTSDGEEAALRIVAESLSNALDHAQAAIVVVSARRSGDWLTLQVSDDGRGLAGNAPTAGPGLRVMRELAHRFGGELSVSNGESGGVEVLARLRFG